MSGGTGANCMACDEAKSFCSYINMFYLTFKKEKCILLHFSLSCLYWSVHHFVCTTDVLVSYCT